MTTEQENTYEKVVDIKSKKPFKQSNKLCDEHQADWVAEEVCKVINKAMKKGQLQTVQTLLADLGKVVGESIETINIQAPELSIKVEDKKS